MSAKNIVLRPIYQPSECRPMVIIFFVSGNGGNLRTAIKLAREYPRLIRVGLVIADRPKIPAITIARQNRIPVIICDFEKKCGRRADQINSIEKIKNYHRCSVEFHDSICERIKDFENRHSVHFDLAVLSYHHWIHGELLKYFIGRMINQHSGDLAAMDGSKLKRKYVGRRPVAMALRAGEKKTRTSTIVVRAGKDAGEIICQGPWVKYTGTSKLSDRDILIHRLKQKQFSDWPSLMFALKEIALGNISISRQDKYCDGCGIVYYKNKMLPYGGFDLSKNKYEK